VSAVDSFIRVQEVTKDCVVQCLPFRCGVTCLSVLDAPRLLLGLHVPEAYHWFAPVPDRLSASVREKIRRARVRLLSLRPPVLETNWGLPAVHPPSLPSS
jgi:hypothetical protein